MPCADCLLHQQPVTGRGLLSSTVAAMPSSCPPPPEACTGCCSPAPLTAPWAQRSHRGSWTMRGNSPVQDPWWGLVCVRSVDWSRKLHVGRGKAWATGGPRRTQERRAWSSRCGGCRARRCPRVTTDSATGVVGGCNSSFWRSRSAGLLVPYAVYKCSKRLHAFEFVSYLVHSLVGGGRDESYTTTVTLFLVWLKSCFYQCPDLLEGSASSVFILTQLRFGQW